MFYKPMVFNLSLNITTRSDATKKDDVLSKTTPHTISTLFNIPVLDIKLIIG